MRIPIADIVFVLLQFVLFVAFVFDVGSMRIYFPEWLFWIGVLLLILGALTTLIAVLQLNVHLSPFPSPLPGSKLIVTGVYKFIRHPIYTGIMIAFFGFAIIADSGYKLLITLLLIVLFYFKSKYEERRLAAIFPGYLEYKRKSGRFFPGL
ncbi:MULTISPECIES: methyltransferase family protein [Aequorivita]|uniref:Isoprenylcysteine carboxylmethyltransferase family protein n=2 Tax=Aequorivita TaxID=153265 RepID=A0AB35YPJ6_9FLAO|nr:isoprenylcysteine carboxylmethyltransferase family protein [Aequorivita sp. Ant34-E75]WGF91518.1 isoprenylcysteine carboxylmethyltransferase family protein [Aequorivita sp. Ant34-E75]